MRVLAHDPYLSAERAAEWGVQLMPLAEMLGQADYVSLHTALSPATERLINQADARANEARRAPDQYRSRRTCG